MKVRLERVGSTNQNLRTDSVEGICDSLPCIGQRFEMFAKPLDPLMDVRCVFTSQVKRVHNELGDLIGFDTQNSSYNLFILEEE